MILLFSDFGTAGPYTGQVKLALVRQGLDCPVIELMSDAPSRNPKAASYLLSAYASHLPVGCVVLAVVDPGVGSALRRPVVLEVDGIFFVGPGNGLFGALCQHAKRVRAYEIKWRPSKLSTSFHGRDLFAPVAAKLFLNLIESDDLEAMDFSAMPCLGAADIAEVVYVDGYGNLITGLRESCLTRMGRFTIGAHSVCHASTFSAVPEGTPFWYVNSSGLVEIAVNCGDASEFFSVGIGHHLNVSY